MSGTDTVTLGHPAWLAPDRHVVVGVDGSQRNDAAVGWAEAEAEATGRPLELVMVLDDAVVPVPHHSLVEDDQRFRDLLDDLTGEIRAAHPKLVVHQAVELGSSVERLLHRSREGNCIVVGRRGLGAFGRALVGSTSIGVAGRSQVPTVIVPDEWDAIARTKSPVVVGIDPEALHVQTLLYAFNQAERRGVELVVVHALDLQPVLVWDPALGASMYEDWTARGGEVLAAAVAPYRKQFRSVRIMEVQERGHPGEVLLERAIDAQLLVIGRQHAGRMGGFAFGSVSRGVLHYATLPVAVIPS
jgi:nucleotide-binding universal stress UspA family protein